MSSITQKEIRNDNIVIQAAFSGDLDIFKEYIQRMPDDIKDYILYSERALSNNHIHIIDYILTICDEKQRVEIHNIIKNSLEKHIYWIAPVILYEYSKLTELPKINTTVLLAVSDIDLIIYFHNQGYSYHNTINTVLYRPKFKISIFRYIVNNFTHELNVELIKDLKYITSNIEYQNEILSYILNHKDTIPGMKMYLTSYLRDVLEREHYKNAHTTIKILKKIGDISYLGSYIPFELHHKNNPKKVLMLCDFVTEYKLVIDTHTLQIIRTSLLHIEKTRYKGKLTDRTEIHCGICQEEMNNDQPILQCKECEKCIHEECQDSWGENCVYCRTSIN